MNDKVGMILCSIFALLLAAVWTGVAKAEQPDSLIVGGFSYHVDTREYTYEGEKYRINELHETIAYRSGTYQVAAGYVHNNSYEKPSVFVAWNPRTTTAIDGLYLGLRLGGASGYDGTPVDLAIAPMAGVEAVYSFGGVSYNLGFIAPEVITFHVEIDL